MDTETVEQLTKVKPLGERAVIKKLEPKERTYGMIVIPQNANEIDLSWTAEVVAVGSGKKLENGDVLEPVVKKGDTVIIEKYVGSEIKIDGEKCYVVRQDDILAIVED